MVQPQQAIPYLPPLVPFYDMQENTALQFNSSRRKDGHTREGKEGAIWTHGLQSDAVDAGASATEGRTSL